MTTRELIRKAQAHVPEGDLEEIVRRIVEVAHPEKIILFGSAVKRPLGPDSDLDLLVIKAGTYHSITVAQEIERNFREIKYATDVIVATPETVQQGKDCPALVFYPALREGKVIYEDGTV